MWWEKYIGIPFVNRGRSAAGVDCGGLCMMVYRQELNKAIAEFDQHYIAWRIREAGQGIAYVRERSFTRVGAPEPFAVAIFSRAGPYHVGICIDRERLLHAKNHEHVKVQRLVEMTDYHNLEGFYVPATLEQ